MSRCSASPHASVHPRFALARLDRTLPMGVSSNLSLRIEHRCERRHRRPTGFGPQAHVSPLGYRPGTRPGAVAIHLSVSK